jgi:hypothetical protein
LARLQAKPGKGRGEQRRVIGDRAIHLHVVRSELAARR